MKSIHQLNIILVADEAAGTQVLRLLKNSQHVLAGVLTSMNSPDSFQVGNSSKMPTNRIINPVNTSLANLSKSFGVPVMDSKLVQDPKFETWMVSHHIDVLLNVYSLCRICPEIIGATRVGAYNLHPGPLPTYSGLYAPSWAVFNEEPTHAVTLHHITEKLDSGDIIYETQFPITSKDTGLSVSIMCVEKGLKLIEQLLIDLSSDPLSVPSRPQDHSPRTYYKRNQIPGSGFIQWSQTAHRIDAFVRACNYTPFLSPWGEPKTMLGKTEIFIRQIEISTELCNMPPGTVGRNVAGRIAVSTADYWILIDKCKVDGTIVSAATLLKDGDMLSAPGK